MFELTKEDQDRGQLVVKHNDLIQKTRHQLSLREQRIVLYLISKIKPRDKNFTEQTFSIAEFCRCCGMDETSGKNYKDIKDALAQLLSRFVWIHHDDESITSLRWVDKATIMPRSGIIKIKLDEDLRPFLLYLEDNYTLYELRYTIAMSSAYSLRLYELLKSHAYKKTVTFEIDELKRLLSAETHKMNGHFKDRVLNIAIPEINKYTDIAVTYKFHKEGQRYSHVQFDLNRKEPTDRFIAALLSNQKKSNASRPLLTSAE